MSRYVIDTWAWVEYFRGTAPGAYVKERIERDYVVTNAVTVAELVSKFDREGLDSDEAFASISALSKICKVNEQFAKDTGSLHAKVKKTNSNFSLADAFALQTAKALGAKVLTGDPDFEGIKEAEILKRGKH